MVFISRCTLLRVIKRASTHRYFATTPQTCRKMNYPTHAQTLGRWAGITSMRLPVHENAEGLDACYVGIPFDSGTSYRSGARWDQIRIIS